MGRQHFDTAPAALNAAVHDARQEVFALLLRAVRLQKGREALGEDVEKPRWQPPHIHRDVLFGRQRDRIARTVLGLQTLLRHANLKGFADTLQHMSLIDFADAARHRTVVRERVLQNEARHAHAELFARQIHLLGHVLVDRAEALRPVVIVRVDDHKRLIDLAAHR